MLVDMPGRFANWWSLRRQRIHAQRLARGPAKVPLLMRLIATGKLIKGLGFIILGCCIGRLVHAPDIERWAIMAMQHIHVDPDGEHAQRAITWLSSVPHARLVEIGAGAFAYAGIYLIEGFGLWFDRRWAEWLTVIGTTLFIPFEIEHLAHQPSIGILVVLVLNVLVVIYLVRRLRSQRAKPSG